ncbi:demethylmenaquinone methyltransferase/2-methoxy-6-polyprenyl-1,4-benzoquinol methylase [Ulvibacter sp. MAR_2010_11]|uniref:bifunctional demethylmenaquinone methyltransferase/2-methoxy-6-polyprenyl-1,4-benzoquinol methylase UbiE n=1 Tax=Ulvibacter sp. MAR_2010_11 TaxID=1250229 RepID=UPI000C2B8201|nr:bifunctional demethylmenaquinone methyltransferase/2-methoxy-6-polyprenyl-1,4-benzoquinol methylase UbiE [Ulvibacter sp. MAR_2010_11]PKA82328.1 demethylmenaquinone methyltransferase/2-methoxy-6-polyprenyl-1,4-benzoquinol methylase [Ulvibacter sp. MAR_2010_11]
MTEKITPYKDSDLNKKKQVEKMFDTISGNYDGLNRVISLGTDTSWRKKVLKMVAERHPNSILDIATGTGDLAIQFAEKINASRIVGLDLSEGMLEMARKKVTGTPLNDKIEFIKGDSEALDFVDGSFEVITVSFGIRNFENLEKGLSEIYRVLAPGGLFIILETSIPKKFPFKQGYYFYTKGLLPLIGRIFSKDKVAYKYLCESASVFPYGETLNNILRKIGFIEVKNKPQTFGVATIYTATK